MDDDKVYPMLITVMILFGEQHLALHEHMTPVAALKEAAHNSAESIIVLDPLNAIELAKELIDASYYCKVKLKEKKDARNKNKKRPDRV